MHQEHFDILKKLVQCQSITPSDDGAIDLVIDFLTPIGFVCQKLQYKNVTNLYAKIGDFQKNICFAGHVDVVPPQGNWSSNPFILKEQDGIFFGRGTNDMKGPLSSALCAIKDYISNNTLKFSISLLITSDEEIMTDCGMTSIIQHLQHEHITCCILCESCSPSSAGDYIKIGCKGSLNIDLTSQGKQCHVVNTKIYPNHIHSFIDFLTKLTTIQLDIGNENFAPSNLEITSIDAMNNVRNLIPEEISAKINIRFNNNWTFSALENFISQQAPQNILLSFQKFSDPFIGTSEKFLAYCTKSIEQISHKKPKFGTLGGNSDAISIHKITDVAEIGSSISGAHITNEYISKKDLQKLYTIYNNIIQNFVNH